MKGLGEKIKSLRKTRELTLVEVAKKAGIDQATLSRIENGVMTGTLESHMRIAEVLGVRLPDLYQELTERAQEAKEKNIRKKLETFSHSSGAVAELLTSGVLQKKMMPILLRLKGRGRTENEEHSPFTERFVYVLKGKLEVTASGEKKALSQGESLYFDASLPHHFANPLKTESWCLSVTTPAAL